MQRVESVVWVIALCIGEDVLDAAPADILRKLFLLGGGRGSAFGNDLVGKFDRVDVGGRLGLLAAAFIERARLNDVVLALYV